MKDGGRMTIKLKEPQGIVFTCPERFRVLVAGRRFGKTYLALIELIRAASHPGRVAWYVAPTYRQAKRVAWKALKAMTKHCQAKPPNETDLTIELTSGGTISLRGADIICTRSHGARAVPVEGDPGGGTSVARS